MSTSDARSWWDVRHDPAPRTGSRESFFQGAAAGMTALIVEDDSRSVFALIALLQRGGMNVLTAGSGLAALDALQHGASIDIVLMDIVMPGMDGYQTMTNIRQRPQSAELPLIAITGRTGDGERKRCMAAGAWDYVPKPIDTSDLLTAITHWLFVATTHLPQS
jgi:CheY-like chemotaxis protein